MDDRGGSVLYTDERTRVASCSAVKVTWYGSLTNYEDLCELYSGCDKLLAKHDPAQLVLTLYLQGYKDMYDDNSSQPQTWLAAAEGSFAFILHDSRTRYTLVARKGSSLPLYWGADNADGDSLIISTVPAHLSPFPPGCAFESQVNDEGEGDSRMFNFVRESPHEQGVDCIRRIDSKGHLCGLTFKSVSGQDLVNMQTASRHVF
ncbi:g351 [Coccomyxa viridis]|uniref:G351 protein n=1 Tax=Coccomyxa viridis TaxID=1274662 RepID=A0ABP1FFI3_9CHLO